MITKTGVIPSCNTTPLTLDSVSEAQSDLQSLQQWLLTCVHFIRKFTHWQCPVGSLLDQSVRRTLADQDDCMVTSNAIHGRLPSRSVGHPLLLLLVL
jgi:hypothetical protein